MKITRISGRLQNITKFMECYRISQNIEVFGKSERISRIFEFLEDVTKSSTFYKIFNFSGIIAIFGEIKCCKIWKNWQEKSNFSVKCSRISKEKVIFSQKK